MIGFTKIEKYSFELSNNITTIEKREADNEFERNLSSLHTMNIIPSFYAEHLRTLRNFAPDCLPEHDLVFVNAGT